MHVRDVCRLLCMALSAPEHVVRDQIFNVGSDSGNYTKDEIVELVGREVPGTQVVYKNLEFGGDMRDIRVSFRKIRETLWVRTNRRRRGRRARNPGRDL